MAADESATPTRAAVAILAGALGVGLAEGVHVLVSSAPSFDGPAEDARFLALELCLLAPVGAAFALFALLFLRVAARTRTRTLGSALLAAPACAYVGWAAFRGASAQHIPGHQLLSVLVAALGLAAVVFVTRGLPAWIASLERRRARAYLLIGAALLLLVADARVLPRLYAFFHRGLELIALALAALAAFALLRWRPRAVSVVVGTIALAVVAALSASMMLAHARVLAVILAERAPLGATLARAYPRAAAAPVVVVPDVLEHRESVPPGPRLGSRDIVLVTIDAMRADRLLPRVMPTAAKLAEGGVRFTDAYTQVPHTSFSIATLLTGKYVYSLSALGLDAASHETLAEVLRRERYKTAAFFPPAVFFIDHARLAPLEKSAYGFEYVKYEYLDAAKRTDQVIDFFEREQPQRAFVWVHYLEPHEPYDEHLGFTAGTPGAPPADPDVSPALVRYEGELRYVDHELARLLDYLRRKRPGALIVLAADHGEEFGEHGGRYHGTTLFDEQVRVPLVFATLSAEGSALPAREVAGPVGLVDVAPTVLAMLGVPASVRMRGRDLSPWMSAKPPSSSLLGPVFGEIDRKKMVVDGSAKLACDLETGGCAFYDRALDPAERRDLSDREPQVAARLHALLDNFLSEESRYEHKATAPPGLERVFERARLGDASVAPELAAALAGMPPDAREAGLRLLVALPADPSTRAALDALHVDGTDAGLLLDLSRARLKDEAARQRLRAALASEADAGAPLSDELYARAAIATSDLELLARAVERTDDRDLVIALANELARTHDPRALAPLLLALAPVRSRAEVVRALGELGDPRALLPLERWLPVDPYVPVRVAIVRVLAALGAAGDESRGVLGAQLASESEATVLTALADALPSGRYDAAELRVLRDGDALSVPKGGQAIVLSSGSGVVRVEGGKAAQATLVDGAATFAATATAIEGRVRLPGGKARVVLRATPPSP
jgi:arylsulfatase A-like enzyme